MIQQGSAAQFPSVVPEIVVTEASSVTIPSQDAVSVVRNIQSIPEDAANETGSVTSESADIPLEQAAATPGPSNKSSGEFETALECNECVVPVPEQSASQSGDDQTTAPLEPEQDEFRTAGVECMESYVVRFTEFYEKVWRIMHKAYAIPFWLSLMICPISAGIVGTLNMYDCPASRSLPQQIFTIGISTMVLFTLRVCLILRRYTVAGIDDIKKMVHTLISITTVLSVVFFLTESVTFWKLPPTTDIHGTKDFCEPAFLSFCYWWNIVMSVLMVPISLFPS